MRILVAGCGGVGSEVIKLLSGHKLVLIDYDKVEISNLNRHIYFSDNDCGKYKSKTIGQKIGCKWIVGRVEEVSIQDLGKFDAIFSCLDSVASRMELNVAFKKSQCPVLIDCGLEEMKLHVKRVEKDGSCLYCIRSVYKTGKETYLCSGRSLPDSVNTENREFVIKALISQLSDKENSDQSVEKIVARFNDMAPESLKTSFFEIYGYVHDIIPNICFTNSICASYAVLSFLKVIQEDFLYYDGLTSEVARKVSIDRNDDCVVCEDF